MTNKNVFQCKDYKSYLLARLAERGARSGRRAEFATHIQCQSSFVSQVLHTDVHLSLEQADRANDYLEHDSSERHFFMLLVQRDRAGSVSLRRYFQGQMSSILKERGKIKNRIVTTHDLSESHKAQYYSHSDYAAIHMALAVPGLREPSALSRSFQLPMERVHEVLDFLLKTGLAQKEVREYTIGPIHLHLGTDSPLLRQHHNNWRLEAMKRMEPQNSNHLHYSSVYSLSREDFQSLKENLLKVIQKNLEVVRPSPEEIVVCQSIDLFPLLRHDLIKE